LTITPLRDILLSSIEEKKLLDLFTDMEPGTILQIYVSGNIDGHGKVFTQEPMLTRSDRPGEVASMGMFPGGNRRPSFTHTHRILKHIVDAWRQGLHRAGLDLTDIEALNQNGRLLPALTEAFIDGRATKGCHSQTQNWVSLRLTLARIE
jgi:hypothetical protein